MESKANYILVGLGVIILCFLTVAFAFWISTAKDTSGLKRYAIYFKEQSLEGLQAESAITMRGIKIGRAISIDISPKNIELLRVVIGVNKDTPVKEDTKAVIRRNLLTGLATIDLTESTAESPRLKKVPEGEDYPVIPEGRSELNQFASTLPELIKKVDSIATTIQGFLSEENRKAFSKILENIETATTVLTTDDINLFEEIATTLHAMRQASATLEEESKKASSSIASTSRVMGQDITRLADTVSQTAKSLSATSEGFENPRQLLTGPNQSTLGPGE